MMARIINRNTKTGSPDKGEPEYVLIGKLRRAHGVTGEIVLGIVTDFPERIKSGKTVYLGNRHTPSRITGCRSFHKDLLITLEGFHNREEVAELTNHDVFVRTSELPPLPDGQLYHHQLIGLSALREDGFSLGTVTEILSTGANDVYVITDSEGRETLIPAVESVVLKIDLESGKIIVRPPEWE
jgi:16S rRNA processing protein RimM